MIHIGSIIRQRLKEKGKTVVWLAHEISYSRIGIYKIFERYSIDTELLRRISAAMNEDFFRIYSEELEKSRTK